MDDIKDGGLLLKNRRKTKNENRNSDISCR